MKKIDITKHELVPQHVLLKETEKTEVLKKYGVSVGALPKISATDPAIKELNANSGDVVKILRKSFTAGKSLYYRTVVKG